MKIYINGWISKKNLKLIKDLEALGKIENCEAKDVKDVKNVDYLVVGKDGNDDLYANVIFEKGLRPDIVPDTFFFKALRDRFPEMFL